MLLSYGNTTLHVPNDLNALHFAPAALSRKVRPFSATVLRLPPLRRK
jgi:hypothetical protein